MRLRLVDPAAVQPSLRDERALLRAWAAGDLATMFHLGWELYAADVRGLLRNEDVPEIELEDLRGDVFRIAVEESDRFDGRYFGAWLIVLAKFRLKTWRRHRDRQRGRAEAHREVTLRDDPLSPVEPGAGELAPWLFDFLEGFMARLTPENALIARTFTEGATDKALAALLRESTGQPWNDNMVRQRRKRMREDARALVAEYQVIDWGNDDRP